MRRLLLTAATIFTTASCAFILDFDELQGGDPAATGGSSGAGGDGSVEGGGCGVCDDKDPCTIDSCDETQSPPQCKFEPTFLVQDGLDHTVDAKLAYRVSLAATTSRFYVSMFEQSVSGTNVRLFGFDAKGSTDVTTGPTFDDFGFSGSVGPVSTLALATNNTAAPAELWGYVAVGNAIGGAAEALVYRVPIPLDLSSVGQPEPTGLGTNYKADSAFFGPSAWKLEGGGIYATWRGTGNEVMLDNGTGDAVAAFPGPAAVTAPAGGANATPGVFYMGSLGPRVQLVGGNPVALEECDQTPGTYISAFSTYAGIANTWLVTWTKLTNNNTAIHSEAHVFACPSPPFCGYSPPDCSRQVLPGGRNPVYALQRRELDPTNTLYEFLAQPYIDASANDAGLDGVLRLTMFRANIGGTTPDAGAQGPEMLQSIELARTMLGPAGEGPDWPALTVVGDRLAVAWIEGDPVQPYRVRMQRYQICYPPDGT